MAADRFSGLSDHLLVCVISFLPARDAARTAVLSRRWRPLWLRTDALNLDSTPYGRLDASQVRDRLFCDAGAALRAPGRCPVRKLSLLVTGPNEWFCSDVMGLSTWSRYSYDLLDALLADVPVPRRIEELRVGFELKENSPWRSRISKYVLHPGVLPGHTLRVLDLACCRLDALPPGVRVAFFPSLSALRLYKCSSQMRDLEDLIRAAPNLGSLHIESQDFFGSPDTSGADRFALHCPSLTTLTLADLQTSKGIQLDAPWLRTFRYSGTIVEFSMRSQATKLTRVDLALAPRPRRYDEPEQIWFAPFWQFLRSLRHARVMKLKVPKIDGIAVDKDMQHEHLVTLLSLERLELEGPSDPGRRNDAAIAIANLLQCCPVIHDLQIRIVTDPWYNPFGRTSREASLSDFDASLDLFKRRYSKEITLMLDRDGGCSEVAELPGLTGCWFDCLQNHLRNVKLQFELKELNSLEVCLAKFFAENCMVLEVLQIDDGKHNFFSHINWMVERWRANASEHRKQMERDSADASKRDSGGQHKVKTKS